MKQHKHAEILRAIADGKEIQIASKVDSPKWEDWEAGTHWSPLDSHECQYRIKPEPPKYPQTKMTDEECQRTWQQGMGLNSQFGGLRSVANAAIARCIQDGDIVPSDMLDKIVDRFAEKVANDFADRYPGPNGYSLMPSEWESIAASQKVKIRAMLDSIIEAAEQGK